MTSKKRAEVPKKVFKLQIFSFFIFLAVEGVRGDLAQALRGGSRELRRQPLA